MILIAVGANLPGPWGRDPVATCERAVLEIGRLTGLHLVAVSRWYRSAPVPASEQPDYCNGVVRLSGSTEPAGLLTRLQTIEQAGGRVRQERNAARTLDLDIIDMDGRVRTVADPLLPHPRAHVRAFVLLPLQDVAPDWMDPQSRRTVAQLLADLRTGCSDAAAPLDWPVPYR